MLDLQQTLIELTKSCKQIFEIENLEGNKNPNKEYIEHELL